MVFTIFVVSEIHFSNADDYAITHNHGAIANFGVRHDVVSTGEFTMFKANGWIYSAYSMNTTIGVRHDRFGDIFRSYELQLGSCTL